MTTVVNQDADYPPHYSDNVDNLGGLWWPRTLWQVHPNNRANGEATVLSASPSDDSPSLDQDILKEKGSTVTMTIKDVDRLERNTAPPAVESPSWKQFRRRILMTIICTFAGKCVNDVLIDRGYSYAIAFMLNVVTAFAICTLLCGLGFLGQEGKDEVVRYLRKVGVLR